MKTEVIWKVRTIQAGHPRPYADSIFEAEIELDGVWYTGRPDFGEERVAEASKGLMRNWNKRKDESREWWETYLESIQKVAPHTWRVKIVQPYCD
jgi:hypothetical protein